MKNHDRQAILIALQKEAIKVLESNLKRMRDPNYVPEPRPTGIKFKLRMMRWRVRWYLENLWDALCGRTSDY